ncbi:hypothetical protein Tco_1245320 [Tanacetum coccineum]
MGSGLMTIGYCVLSDCVWSDWVDALVIISSIDMVKMDWPEVCRIVVLRVPFLALVMAAPVISISSDSSDESVGSVMPRVILFGTILTDIPVVPADLPVAPEVTAAAVASPAGALESESHSSSETGPSESPLPPVPVAPMVSPFLCSDDSESEPAAVLPERHVSSAAHDAMVGRWRSRVMSRPSASSESPSFSAPFSRRSAVLIRPGQAIPFGQPYRTHPNGSRQDSIEEDIDAGVSADVGAGTDVGLEVDSVIASAERAGLSSRIAALERRNTRLRETLRLESVRADMLRRRLVFVEDELRLIRRSRYYERMRFRRFETFAARRMGFRP